MLRDPFHYFHSMFQQFDHSVRSTLYRVTVNCKLLVPHLNSNPLECILFSQYHYINPISTHTHTHPFNGPLSRTTWVSRYQKGKTDLDFTEARGSEWHWHQLGHMQDCVSLQTDNHASTPHSFFYRPDALPAAQPTVSKH